LSPYFGSIRKGWYAGCFALLAGCASINGGALFESDEAEQIAFTQVDLTPEAIRQANQSRYTPKNLPSGFYSDVGISRGQSAPPPPALAPVAYQLGPNDVVSIKGRQQDILGSELGPQIADGLYRLRDDGTVEIPGVGRLELGNLTIGDANRALMEFLVEARIDPTYSLEIETFNARAVSVEGAVGSPGIVPLTQSPLTLARAIALSGGLRAEDRAAARVNLFRDGDRYSLPGDDVATMAAAYLQDGDTIVVEQGVTAEEQRLLYTQRDTLGAVPRDHVFIAGEVSSPRMTEMPLARQMNLAELLLEDGGVPLISGDLSQVYVLRTYGMDDQAVVYHLNAGNVVNLTLATRFELRPNDIVYVSERPVTVWSRFFSQLEPTGIAATANVLRN
jgi:polysaccharide export outer membrane protein